MGAKTLSRRLVKQIGIAFLAAGFVTSSIPGAIGDTQPVVADTATAAVGQAPPAPTPTPTASPTPPACVSPETVNTGNAASPVLGIDIAVCLKYRAAPDLGLSTTSILTKLKPAKGAAQLPRPCP